MPSTDYFDVIERTGAHHNAENWRFYLTQILDGVDLAGKRVLDVGGGTGLLTLYAATRGADVAVLLEPELEGSSAGMQETFERTAEAMGVAETASLVRSTLQDFDWDDDGFDIIFLHNSINHLDEPATERLHRDPEAFATFEHLFGKLAGLCRPGARVLVADCDRYNFWRFMPVRSPVAPSIEWHKHQPPERWARAAKAAGFRKESVVWTSYNRLRRPGRLLLGHRATSFLLNSHFAMWLRLEPGAGST